MADVGGDENGDRSEEIPHGGQIGELGKQSRHRHGPAQQFDNGDARGDDDKYNREADR